MAATVGNKYYKLRSKDGRNKIFENAEDLNTEIEKYFQEKSESFINKPDIIKSGDLAGENIQIKIDDFPTKEELSIYLGFAKWESLKNYKEYTEDFLEVITWAETVIYNWKLKYTAIGVLNANIIARDLGIADKQDLTTNGESISFGSFLKKSNPISE
ncbi:hypothetical protein HHL23_09600 [Chryseobacterium sp. RP-3-3]|uniref:Uncharacterized protein n=1 Tax=Chryseobacterium antibioticum TaxID=2728847 RepID=A0A7Y0AMQ1_9FLAO|nr:terminase small subunit [Chryseobacterium antibioticum]NML70055.1 hypothetical protein [Chryseobacterium antibioticum]